jgi:carboxymethylenebutenolidase
MCHDSCPAPISGGAGIAETTAEVPGSGVTLPALLARPDHDDPAPGILIIHDVNGPNAFYRDLARRLAGEGFVALLPDLFVREGKVVESSRDAVMERAGRLDQASALADIAAALDLLREHPATTGAAGAIGFCMGGTFVMLAAARDTRPDAVVAFYGFPARPATERAPRRPLDEAAEVRSPLLAFWGDADAGVGMENVEAYRTALVAADIPHEFEIYPGYPHGFLTFDEASPWAEKSRDAWARTLGFLRAELGG